MDRLKRNFYMCLMSGLTAMLPFAIGGGFLIAVSHMIDPAAVEFGMITSGSSAAWFFGIMGNIVFLLMLPVFAGAIAESVADKPASMPGFVGGILAVIGVTAGKAQGEWLSSGFAGALAAGFAAGGLMLLIAKVFDHLPSVLSGMKGSFLYPCLGALAISAVMVFILNPSVGVFTNWFGQTLVKMPMAGRIVIGAALAGMMAVDFGGPLNKASYILGMWALSLGQIDFVAAVMIGGMTPALGVAAASVLFKKKFTAEESGQAASNLIKGLIFITEAVIPFAAKDPKSVIPSCMIGSAVAGAVLVGSGCGSWIAHGGIFSVIFMENPLMVLAALFAGTIVTVCLLAILKKPVTCEGQIH